MSTRALYSFIGDDGSYNIYKHHDGYPSGAAKAIKCTIDWFAWQLPRYESDEFAAAFCAAGKTHSFENVDELVLYATNYGPKGQYHTSKGGGVRLMPQGNPGEVACKNCSDIAYRYEIKMGTPLPEYIEKRARKIAQTPTLLVKAFEGNW